MVRNTLTRLVLPVVLALLGSAAFAQVIDYTLPQTQCGVQYNRSYYGTFVCPQYPGAVILETINGTVYDLTFSFYVDATKSPQQIVASRSIVSFCQHGVVPAVCSTGSPSGTFQPLVAPYWGRTDDFSFVADGAAGKFDGTPGSTLIFFKPGRGASYLNSDSVLRLQ